jgi:hypothetical protein
MSRTSSSFCKIVICLRSAINSPSSCMCASSRAREGRDNSEVITQLLLRTVEGDMCLLLLFVQAEQVGGSF